MSLPPVWNLNWAHAQGKITVLLAGGALGEPVKVALASEAGGIESTNVFVDPETGTIRAKFPKGAAFRALVPEDALRGDTVPVTVELTTALGVTNTDTAIRLVGPKKKIPLGKRGPKAPRAPKAKHGRNR